MTGAENRKWLQTVPVAHRGLHDVARGVPENSLEAFEAAIDRGYAIELDVHLLADGEVVTFHDMDLMRLTGQAGAITDQTVKSLAGLRLLGTNSKVPLFSEVLSLVNGRAPMLVEIKSNGTVGPLEAAVLRAMAGYDGAIAIQSFNPSTVEWFKINAPHIARGLLSGTFQTDDMTVFRKLILRSLLPGLFGRPYFFGIQVECLTWLPSRIARWLGFPVLAWTVRTQQQEKVARQYADNIIFESIVPRQVV